jgi:hypothetical protein
MLIGISRPSVRGALAGEHMSPPTISARPIAGITIGLASLTFVSDAGASDALSIPTIQKVGATPAALERESLQRDFRGLTDAAADRALAVQRLSPKLQDELTKTLGQGFGGLWIDPENPGKIVVRVVPDHTSAKAEALRAGATAAASSLGLASDITYVSGSISADALTALQSSLDQGLSAVNSPGLPTVDAEPDIVRGKVQLTVPPHPTEGQRAFVLKAKSAFRRLHHDRRQARRPP